MICIYFTAIFILLICFPQNLSVQKNDKPDPVPSIRNKKGYIEFLKTCGQTSVDHLFMFRFRELYDNFMADFKSTPRMEHEVNYMERYRYDFFNRGFNYDGKDTKNLRTDVLNDPKIYEKEKFCRDTKPMINNPERQKTCNQFFPLNYPFLSDISIIKITNKGPICTIEFTAMQGWNENVFDYETMLEEYKKPRISYRTDRMNVFVFLRPTPDGRFLFDIHEKETTENFHFRLRGRFYSMKVKKIPYLDITLSYSYFSCKSGLFEIDVQIIKIFDLTVEFRILSRLGVKARIIWHRLIEPENPKRRSATIDFSIDKVHVSLPRPGVYLFYAVCLDYKQYFTSTMEGPIVINVKNKWKTTGPVVSFDYEIFSQKIILYFKKPYDDGDLPPVYLIVLRHQNDCTHYYELLCEDCGHFLSHQRSLDYQVETICPNGKNGSRYFKLISFKNATKNFYVTLENLKPDSAYKLSIVPVTNAVSSRTLTKEFTTKRLLKKQYVISIYLAFFTYSLICLIIGLASVPIIRLYMKRGDQMAELSLEKDQETDLEFINCFQIDEKGED